MLTPFFFKKLLAKAKKNIELFLRPPFGKTDASEGGYLIFIQQKTDAGTFFFETRTIYFLKLCFDCYFIGYYPSQAIKLDSKNLCTLSRFELIIDAYNLHCMGSIANKKTVENIARNNRNGGQNK